MLTPNASKTKKTVLPNITISLNVVSENAITFVKICHFLKIKKIADLRKPVFFRKPDSLRMCNCLILRRKCLLYS